MASLIELNFRYTKGTGKVPDNIQGALSKMNWGHDNCGFNPPPLTPGNSHPELSYNY